jgi:hypothetical protein
VTTRRTDYDRVARAIVDIARRAPSVDNTQPWTWCPDRADLGLRADLARALPASDPDGRLLTISCGAALHYARTTAESTSCRARAIPACWRVSDWPPGTFLPRHRPSSTR